MFNYCKVSKNRIKRVVFGWEKNKISSKVVKICKTTKMKKSLIWLLTIVMAITFGALLYFQIMYLENMVRMRKEQFSENVMRSLHATVGMLERRETLTFLVEDMELIGSGEDYDLSEGDSGSSSVSMPESSGIRISYPSPTENVSQRYRHLRETLKSHYMYQRGLLNEVILNILQEAPSRPIAERADSTDISGIQGGNFGGQHLPICGMHDQFPVPFPLVYGTVGGTFRKY